MIPEPQRCGLGKPRVLLTVCVAYGTALAVVAGVVAFAIARSVQ